MNWELSGVAGEVSQSPQVIATSKRAISRLLRISSALRNRRDSEQARWVPSGSTVCPAWIVVYDSGDPVIPMSSTRLEQQASTHDEDAVNLVEQPCPVIVVDEVLRDVSHHHDEIGEPARHVVGDAVDPCHGVAARSQAGDIEHRRGRIDADDAAAAAREGHGQHAGATTDVDHRSGSERGGERQVEVVVLPAEALRVVHSREPWVLGPQLRHSRDASETHALARLKPARRPAAAATGRLDFKDVVADGSYVYRG
jgi:hypothetical protein